MANKNISKSFLAALLAAFALSSCGETAASEESTESEETIIISDSEESSETSSEEEPEESSTDSSEEPVDETITLDSTFTGGTLAGGEDLETAISYIVTEDLFLTSTIVIEGYVELDLNGHLLYLQDGGGSYVINVTSGSLTLVDNSEDTGVQYYAVENDRYYVDDGTDAWDEAYASAETTGVTDGGAISSYNAVGVHVGTGTTFVLEGGNIVGNAPSSGSYGGGFDVDGTLVVNGGGIIGNYASRGGAIGLWGSATINGGTIAGNYGTSGSALYITGTLEINGGEITGNVSPNYGAVYSTGTVTMNGGTILGNEGGSYPGVYMPSYYGSFNMYEGRLGDASYNAYGVLTIYQGYMSEAAYSASSRYIDSSSTVMETGDEDWPYRIEMA